MKAKITTPTLSNMKREILQNVIPLSVPFWICIDPSSACNIRCKYCVQFDKSLGADNGKFKVQTMPLELAYKIIDDLKEFEKPVKVLNWHGWGEPLLNKNLPEMIKYSNQQNVTLSNQTITNGILLTREMSDRLIESGLSRINISVQSTNADGYFDISGKRIDFEEFVRNIRYLYEHKGDNLTVYIKIGDMALKDEDARQQFYNIFGDICDEIYVEKIINVRMDSAANVNIPKNTENIGVIGQEAIERSVCPYLFYRLIICPDGVCALCNADWYRDFVVGNAAKQSVKEIWNSEILHNLQKKHLQDERQSISLCSKCGNIKYYAVDNIDPYASALLKKYEEAGI
jgi:MoaA/NifB/PqqE/SkfB family radical SAM enzyme